MKKKKNIIIVSVLALIVLMAVMIAFALGLFKAPEIDLSLTKSINVENGVAQPVKEEIAFTIEKSGNYTVNAAWEAEPEGLLTGCMLLNEAGEVLHASTAGWWTWTSAPFKLEEGNYTFALYFISNMDDFVRFFEEAGTPEEDILIMQSDMDYTFAENGSWEMQYDIKLVESNFAKKVGIIWGVAVGIVLVVIMLTVTKRGDEVGCRYDERQELIRGRGFKYAFFTILISNLIIFVLCATDMLLWAGTDILVVLTTLLGVMVYACYCIWNDAYFALNEKRIHIIMILVAVGISNLVLGLGAIMDGRAWQNGQLTIHSLNLYCGIMMLVIGAVMLLKKICKDGKDE